MCLRVRRREDEVFGGVFVEVVVGRLLDRVVEDLDFVLDVFVLDLVLVVGCDTERGCFCLREDFLGTDTRDDDRCEEDERREEDDHRDDDDHARDDDLLRGVNPVWRPITGSIRPPRVRRRPAGCDWRWDWRGWRTFKEVAIVRTTSVTHFRTTACAFGICLGNTYRPPNCFRQACSRERGRLR